MFSVIVVDDEMMIRTSISAFINNCDVGFEVVGIVGANRSPNCGVDTTSDDNREQKGMGIFMEKISGELSKRGITVPMAGIRASDDIAAVLDTFL